MSIIQIEGFDTFLPSIPSTDQLKTKLSVTNPLGAFSPGGNSLAFPAGRTSGSSYRPDNTAPTAHMQFGIYPKFRAASAYTDELIWGFAFKIDTIDGNKSMTLGRVLLDSGGAGMDLVLLLTGTTQFRFQVWKGHLTGSDVGALPGGSQLITTIPNPFALGVWGYVEFRFKCDLTSSGTAEIRINGAGAASFAGITQLDAGDSTSLHHFFKRHGLTDMMYDDMYWVVNDGVGNSGFLGDVFVETLRPTGDGASTDWVPFGAGFHFVEVDEVGADFDTTYIRTNTSLAEDLFTLPNLTDITANVIKAVQLSSVDRNEAIGLADIDAVTKTTGGTFLGTKQGLVQDTPYEGHYMIWEKNPETSIDWLRTEIDASEFGVRLQ